jgi:hypothetical protein
MHSSRDPLESNTRVVTVSTTATSQPLFRADGAVRHADGQDSEWHNEAKQCRNRHLCARRVSERDSSESHSHAAALRARARGSAAQQCMGLRCASGREQALTRCAARRYDCPQPRTWCPAKSSLATARARPRTLAHARATVTQCFAAASPAETAGAPGPAEGSCPRARPRTSSTCPTERVSASIQRAWWGLTLRAPPGASASGHHLVVRPWSPKPCTSEKAVREQLAVRGRRSGAQQRLAASVQLRWRAAERQTCKHRR